MAEHRDDGKSSLDGEPRLQNVAIQVDGVTSTARDDSPTGKHYLARNETSTILGRKNATFVVVVLVSSLMFGLVCTMISFNFDFFKVNAKMMCCCV
jgi:hypothetical protein